MSLYPTHRSLSLSDPAGIPAGPKPCRKRGRIASLSLAPLLQGSSWELRTGRTHPGLPGLGSCNPDPCLSPAHSPSPFIFPQWRVFLPSLKFEVIDSSYISLYTGKGRAAPAATAGGLSRGCTCWQGREGERDLGNGILGADLSL